MNRKQFPCVNYLSSVPNSNRLTNQQAHRRAQAREFFQLKWPCLINWLCISMETALIPWVNHLAWKSIPWWFAYKELAAPCTDAPLITISAEVRCLELLHHHRQTLKTHIKGSEYLLNTSTIKHWVKVSAWIGLMYLSEMRQMFKEGTFLSKRPWVMKPVSASCAVLECVCNSCASPFSHRQSDVPLKSVSRDTAISYCTYHRPALTSLKSTLNNHTQRWEWNTVYWVVAYASMYCTLPAQKTKC